MVNSYEKVTKMNAMKLYSLEYFILNLTKMKGVYVGKKIKQ